MWLGSKLTPNKAAIAFLGDGRGLAAAEPREAATPAVDGRCGSLAVLAACEVGCAGVLAVLPSSAALPSHEAAASAAAAAVAALEASPDTAAFAAFVALVAAPDTAAIAVFAAAAAAAAATAAPAAAAAFVENVGGSPSS